MMDRSQDAFGPLLESSRTRRQVSQLDLAMYAGMLKRHISFLETGRSKPSRHTTLACGRHASRPASLHLSAFNMCIKKPDAAHPC